MLSSFLLDVYSFLDLEVHKAWQVLFGDTLKAWGSENCILDLCVAVASPLPIKILAKSKDHLTNLILGEAHDILEGVNLLWLVLLA